MIDTKPLKDLLVERFGGVFRSGSHRPNGACCILEAVSQLRKMDWTDSPAKVGMPDIRSLNDASWSSDEKRTEQMLRLYAMYGDWAGWTDERKIAVMKTVALETVRQVISALPGLPDDVEDRCRSAKDLADAAAAARAIEDSYSDVAEHAFADAARTSACAATCASDTADAACAAARAADRAAGAAALAADHAADAAARAAALAADHAARAADRAAEAVLVKSVDIWVNAATTEVLS